MLFPGAYQEREESNMNWYAGFYLNFASETVMEDNVVAGMIIIKGIYCKIFFTKKQKKLLFTLF